MSIRSSPHVCLVTPGSIGSNPRTFKQAHALHESGYRVTVIATRLKGKRDDYAASELPWRMHYVDLRSAAKWYGFRLLHTGVSAAARALGWRSLMRMSASPFSIPLRIACLSEKADLYIAHYPPSLPAVAAAARRNASAYAYDAEDFHLGHWPEGAEFDSEREGIRHVEAAYLPGTVFATGASPLICQAVADAYQISLPTCILNCFPKAQAPPVATGPTATGPDPTLYWFSQTIGPNRGLETVIEAMGRSRSRPALYLRGTVARGYDQTLLSIAKANGVGDRVHFLDPAPPTQMETLAAGHALGLCTEPGGVPNNEFALSNKLFSFLLAGLPPLMSDTPAQVRFAEEAGLEDLLYPRGDPQALADLIDRYLLDLGALAALRQQVWALGQRRYNWETEAPKFLALVARALDRTPSRLPQT